MKRVHAGPVVAALASVLSTAGAQEEVVILEAGVHGPAEAARSAWRPIEGLRRVNDVIGDTPLPRVSDETIEGILHRDAVGLLGLGP